MMPGESRQDKNRIFVGDQLEAVCKALRRAVEFRAKLPIAAGRALYPASFWIANPCLSLDGVHNGVMGLTLKPVTAPVALAGGDLRAPDGLSAGSPPRLPRKWRRLGSRSPLS